jgi:hypothetical protein
MKRQKRSSYPESIEKRMKLRPVFVATEKCKKVISRELLLQLGLVLVRNSRGYKNL